MNNRYLDNATVFSESDLLYKFNTFDVDHDRHDMILTEKMLGDDDIRISRHDWRMRAMYHSLQVLKIAYVYKGTFLIYTDGKPSILPEGSVCIVPPGAVQKFTIDYSRTDTDMQDTVLFNFLLRRTRATSLLAPLFDEKSPLSDYLRGALYGENVPKYLILRTPSEFSADIAALAISELIRSGETKESPTVACRLLCALLQSFLPSPNGIFEYASSYIATSRPIERILHCIQTDYKTVDLEELCEKFHYTSSYVCRLIRRHTGKSFKEYLTDERLDCVCREMLASDKPICLIAAEAGWHTTEHFYRVFRKKYGMTPSNYRKTLRKELFSGEKT